MTSEGDLIRQAIRDAGLNDQIVSKKIGMSPQFLGKIQNHGTQMPIRFIKPFCKLTKIKVTHFIAVRVYDLQIKLEMKLK